jgi:ATP-binding cassette subfamily B protein
MRKFFVPEMVQTSGMDCGPASLKSLLSGFGIPVSYGRLREACQTDLDGTSIDTMETVANQLGLEAEQIMLPADHVALPAAKALPAIAVVTLPNGLTHFVVAWRRHGRYLQVMDPAAGRRWISCRQFEKDLYRHTVTVPATDWRQFAASGEFKAALTARLRASGVREREAGELIGAAQADEGWRSVAALDAAIRLCSSLIAAGALRRGAESYRFIRQMAATASSIPARYWLVTPAPAEEDEEQLSVRGAVLVRITGVKNIVQEDLGPELKAAIGEKQPNPVKQLVGLLRASNAGLLSLVVAALALAASATLMEALLFRGLFDVAADLALPLQRMGAIAAVLLFCVALLVLEIPICSVAMRLGRQLEARLRLAFLEKIPRLGDRYFQSRLTSDMAERSHALYRIRNLPDLTRKLLRAFFELCATSAGIIWLEPASLPWVLAIACAALLPSVATQSVLVERDLRARNHAAGLTRFYLDAMLGLTAIRAHGAERSVRREHEKLLGAWAEAALGLQRMVVAAESVQMLLLFGLITSLVVFRSPQHSDPGRLLLVVYWILNIPVLGQKLTGLLRQYPYYRNLTLRLLEPLGAPEENTPSEDALKGRRPEAPGIEFRAVSVTISNQQILRGISTKLEAGSHTAVVGLSGAGKSSLAALLLGILRATEGEILVNGLPLNVEDLRRRLAWCDPAVRLWNRSLHENLTYGAQGDIASPGFVIESAGLRKLLETLPDGMQTALGEGGSLVSGGEGQRVRFGRALFRETGLVILDEPFRNLDRETRRQLLRRARTEWQNQTLLCITHDIAETVEFDRVLVIEGGRIVEEGSPSSLRHKSNSRYAQLLAAEQEARSGLWSSSLWRHIRLESGQIVEIGSVPTAEELEQYAEEAR